LPRYEDSRHPDAAATSRLIPYLHFGHLSVHEVWKRLTSLEGWTPDALSPHRRGQKAGFWGMSSPAEAFVDELVTWRELGHNFATQRDDFDRYESLPEWARTTLERHASDPRPSLYSLEELARADTHDSAWNAGQRELVETGGMHGYLRMLWRKKILERRRTPGEVLNAMIELNNGYALDGRDPSSYSGIFWCLGRYDRLWGPERPIFGRVRFMSSTATKRKLRMSNYPERLGG
jgi:deoxyribodipyrimidine photo-lyase